MNFKMAAILERKDFSNSKSLCCSHQVLAQSDLWFGRRCTLKNFKHQNGMILAILSNCVPVMPPIKFWLSLTYSLRDVV